MPDKTSELINSSSALLSGNDNSLNEKNVYDVAKCSENLNVSSSHLTVSSKDEHIVTLPPADNSLYRDSTSVKTKSKEIKQECDENFVWPAVYAFDMRFQGKAVNITRPFFL